MKSMSLIRYLSVLVCFCVFTMISVPCLGDAIIVNRSMKASTIAEIHVDRGTIRTDIEVGLRDLKAFRNLLPDALYEKLGYKPNPLTQRLAEFLAKDWVYRVENKALAGRVVSAQPRKRIIRDEITGFPLPVQPDDAPLVIAVKLEHTLIGQPTSLSIQPPLANGYPMAAVGFVVYHEGLQVNDFRYLAQEMTLTLDWSDPWYSTFNQLPMKRQFSSPVGGFLYIDPYEVRKEIIIRPRDLQRWVDLGLAGKKTISVADQPEIKRKATEFLAAHCPVTVDGKPVTMELDRVHFIRRTLRRTGVIDPPEPMSIDSAMMGVIFVLPRDGMPKRVAMTWDLFDARIPSVPVSAVDDAGAMPGTVTPEDPVLVWENFLTTQPDRSLMAVAAPTGRKWNLPVGSIVAVVLALIAAVMAMKLSGRRRRVGLIVTVVLVAAGALCWPMLRMEVAHPTGEMSALSPAQSREVVQSLLTNIYRAFDRRSDEAIYDTLARSVSGDELTDIYLQTRRALTVQNQGGARVRIREVDVQNIAKTDLPDGGIRIRAEWVAGGDVGHWGHTHRRRNRYEADFDLRIVDGVWKISHIQLRNEKRL